MSPYFLDFVFFFVACLLGRQPHFDRSEDCDFLENAYRYLVDDGAPWEITTRSLSCFSRRGWIVCGGVLWLYESALKLRGARQSFPHQYWRRWGGKATEKINCFWEWATAEKLLGALALCVSVRVRGWQGYNVGKHFPTVVTNRHRKKRLTSGAFAAATREQSGFRFGHMLPRAVRLNSLI